MRRADAALPIVKYTTAVLAVAIEQYKDYIPSPHLIEAEINNWRCTYLTLPKDKVASTIARAIKKIDAACFPNVFVLLKLVATSPKTSCDCERSFSNMWRFKSWLYVAQWTLNATYKCPLRSRSQLHQGFWSFLSISLEEICENQYCV